jgi:hypothetical protein
MPPPSTGRAHYPGNLQLGRSAGDDDQSAYDSTEKVITSPTTKSRRPGNHRLPLRRHKRASGGVAVKDLRPLTRSASGRSLTPPPNRTRPKHNGEHEKEKIKPLRAGLTRPRSFRDECLRSRTLVNSYQHGSADQPSTTALPTPGQVTSAWTSYVPSPMVTYREDVNRKVARMYTSQNV